VVSRPKIDRQRAALGSHARVVHFADMREVGPNPARIIPAWRAFVTDNGGGARPMRGIGEPITAERRGEERVESHIHESLLNRALHDTALWLVCPYDTRALDADDLEHAHHNHPWVTSGEAPAASTSYDDDGATLRRPLPPAPNTASILDYDLDTLAAVRGFTASHADRFGMSDRRRSDFVVSVNEVATNSVRHASGSGQLRCWVDDDSDGDDALVCELVDEGIIDEPLVGRIRPVPGSDGGYGLWLANQMCDLVQVRNSAGHTTIRLHMRR
jgi:anti-sigma regulatory factor (Ser/Thr protein kinase)